MPDATAGHPKFHIAIRGVSCDCDRASLAVREYTHRRPDRQKRGDQLTFGDGAIAVVVDGCATVVIAASAGGVVDRLGVGGRRGGRRGHGAVVCATAVAAVVVAVVVAGHTFVTIISVIAVVAVVVVAVRDSAASATNGRGLTLGNCAVIVTAVVAGHTIITIIGASR